jgi:L,D-peptidoglycan transpeptidase YkuD (ErfK/YbiS/YcfS/YnhG family)
MHRICKSCYDKIDRCPFCQKHKEKVVYNYIYYNSVFMEVNDKMISEGIILYSG